MKFGKFEKNLGATLKKNKKPSKGYTASVDKKRVPAPSPVAK